jgi:alkylated DNA repair dioxygenase AlkB
MPQEDLFRVEPGNPGMEIVTGCRYFPAFLKAQDADSLLSSLWNELSWRQQKIRIFGREVMQPRLICWQSDPGINYSYSGLDLLHSPWHPQLDGLRSKMQSELGLVFNSVLVNAYRNGQDSMGWHSDDEPELGKAPAIASISLGAERMFRVREKRARRSAGFILQNGSLLLMSGEFQARNQHSVPKSKTVHDLRINLTFRRIFSV